MESPRKPSAWDRVEMMEWDAPGAVLQADAEENRRARVELIEHLVERVRGARGGAARIEMLNQGGGEGGWEGGGGRDAAQAATELRRELRSRRSAWMGIGGPMAASWVRGVIAHTVAAALSVAIVSGPPGGVWGTGGGGRREWMPFVVALIVSQVVVFASRSLGRRKRGRQWSESGMSEGSSAAAGVVCPDCEYNLAGVNEIEPAVLAGEFLGPMRCPECGVDWPLVPPEAGRAPRPVIRARVETKRRVLRADAAQQAQAADGADEQSGKGEQEQGGRIGSGGGEPGREEVEGDARTGSRTV